MTLDVLSNYNCITEICKEGRKEIGTETEEHDGVFSLF